MYSKSVAVICELCGTTRQGGEQLAMLRMATYINSKSSPVSIHTYTSSNKSHRIESLIPLKFRLIPYIRDMFFLPFLGVNLLKKLERIYSNIVASSTTLSSFYKPTVHFVIICHIIRSQRFENLSKLPFYGIFFNPITFKIISTLESKALNNADNIIVLRERQRKFLVEKLKILNNKITIIPNGINTDVFKPKKIKKKNQIIFVGRGTIGKGLDTLLEASDSIAASILLVTHRIDEKFLQIAKSKTNINIKFSATAEELSQLYSESLLFVLPSRDEEQPLSTLEAMSCGLPVVVTKEGASDIVKDGINGIIIHDDNPQQLSSAVNALIKDKRTAKRMSLVNRTNVVKHYSLKKIAIQLDQIIHA